MLKLIDKYFKDIVSAYNDAANLSPITLISGGLGTGKTFLFNSILDYLHSSNSVDAILKLDSIGDSVFITDLLNDKKLELIQPDTYGSTSQPLSELDYNFQQLHSEIEILKSLSSEDYSAYELAFKLKSSYFWANNFSSIRDADTIANNSIKSNFSKKSTHRLLLDTYTVSIESFIVDLMNIFYAFTDSDNPIIKMNRERKRIVIAIDELDAINGSMYLFFISYLIPYFYEKTFGEFSSYHISFIDSSMKVSDLFDFRVIYTSRNSFESLIPNISPEVVELLKHYTLTNLSVQEYEEIVNTIALPNLVSSASHFEITQAIPALVFDKQAANLSGEYDFNSFIVNKAFADLTKYFNNKDKQILFALSFTETIDRNYFKYLHEPKLEVFEVENFLMYNSFLLDSNKKEALLPEIIYIVKNYLKFHNRILFDSLNLFKINYSKINTYFTQFSESEYEIIETLAFLPKDNNLELSRLAFADNYEELEALYKNNRMIFNSSKYFMNPDVAQNIKDFVKAINPEKYKSLSNLSNSLKSRIDEEKERIEVQKTAEIKTLEKEYNSIDSNINSRKNEYKTYQNKLMLTENLMIDLRRQINNNSFSTNTVVASISLGFTTAIGMIAYFLPNILQPESDISPIYSIQFILFSIFSILLVFTIVFSSKVVVSYKKKALNPKLIEDLNLLEDEKANHLQNMQLCKGIIDNLQTRKKELHVIINK